MAGVCFLDMSAAFDIVDHQLLLSKLELYGFDGGMLTWVLNYLSERYQCVSIDGALSKLLNVQHGAPKDQFWVPSCTSFLLMRFQR